MKTNDLKKIRTQMARQMRRGVLELCILSIVSEKEAYPSDIIKELKASELIVVEGTLYPLLSRMKDQGLLQYNWQESSMGPPRKYYSITDTGREFLKGLLETWDQLVEAVNRSTKNISTNE
ncbi:MAG: PadR family transcriptional regulator [Phaeodactylibacter sp.]|nr:PadR family transcriptional regulator [Phaeodactylibacter sp.]MCB9263565.1 PadR family transcriptional regulator [Lewinellaceae bacterium]MCB9287558.1 PadR family transcriptional regulator [Lewinellaceae bacterium]